MEVSVVIPCLNEADTLRSCIAKASRAMREHNIVGEIVVADNGSTDLSQTIAASLGTRVLMVKEPGYGSALMGGIAAATGQYIIMGDADDSYDFLEIPKFVEKLREGFDLVQGCRLPAGGGIGSTRRDALFTSLGGQSIFFLSSPGSGSGLQSMTFTVGCVVLQKPCTDGLICVVPGWSSPPR